MREVHFFVENHYGNSRRGEVSVFAFVPSVRLYHSGYMLTLEVGWLWFFASLVVETW